VVRWPVVFVRAMPQEETLMPTVRDATFDVLRRHGLTTVFANPGSTEVSFLTDLPDDLQFVLALHEGSVVGIATGWATAREQPALVNLHTTAGLGNAVGALATARYNRVPLVVIVGQQDRRHLAFQPFLAGELQGLAGSYPVWVDQPLRAQDVPSAVARAWHEAVDGRGPALVIVPSDDWATPADGTQVAAPVVLRRAAGVDPAALDELVDLLAGADSPALVVGADADDAETWAALVELAERLGCPVWQEAFAARAGFPQDHRLFAGHLPAGRARLRQALDGHDVVLSVGAPVFRQYPYEPGPFVTPGTTLALVTDDVEDAHHSPVDLAVVARPAPVCWLLAQRLPDRRGTNSWQSRRTDPPRPPQTGEPLRAAHVMAALAERLPADTVVVEETPSSRPDLHRLLPARKPLGFLSAAMGGLGFAMPAAIGVRMACPERPVVAVVGDGSSLYGIQSLWSAVHYGCGVLFVVLANGRYAIMDRLAEQHGEGKAPWPAFEEVSVQRLAEGFGCPAERLETYDAVIKALDEVVPTLSSRTEPLVLDVAVMPDATFEP
jgi:thiamine pyrophosphate-dependent acetolactate synthase large subunit-like protein